MYKFKVVVWRKNFDMIIYNSDFKMDIFKEMRNDLLKNKISPSDVAQIEEINKSQELFSVYNLIEDWKHDFTYEYNVETNKTTTEQFRVCTHCLEITFHTIIKYHIRHHTNEILTREYWRCNKCHLHHK